MNFFNRLIVLLALFLTLLVACSEQQTPQDITSDVVKDGYELSFRVGTANLQESFFSPIPITATSVKSLYQNLAQANSILQPQARSAVGVNFFVSLTKNGRPLEQDVLLTFRGPNGSLVEGGEKTYTSGSYWSDYLFFASEGSGTYKVDVRIGNVYLVAGAELNESSVLSSDVAGFHAGATEAIIGFNWSKTVAAESYLLIVWNGLGGQAIWAGATKQTHLIDEVVLPKQNEQFAYDATLISASWDTTASYDTAYPDAMPENVNTSAIGKYLDWPGNGGLWINPSPLLTLATKPNKVESKTVVIGSRRGVVGYSYTVENAPANLSWTAPENGVFFKGAPLTIDFKLACSELPQQDRATVKVITTETAQPTINIPLVLECEPPTPTIAMGWENSISAHVLSLSHDGSKLALYANFDILILDALTGATLNTLDIAFARNMGLMTWGAGNALALPESGGIRILDAITAESIVFLDVPYTIYQTLWMPDGKKLLTIGKGDKATLWDGATGEVLNTFNLTISPLSWVELSPDGTKIATPVSTNELAIYDSTTGNELHRFTLLEKDSSGEFDEPLDISRAAWSPDSQQIAAISDFDNGESTLFGWNVETGELLIQRSSTFNAYYLVFLQDDYLLDLTLSEARFISAFSGSTLSQTSLPYTMIDGGSFAISQSGDFVIRQIDNDSIARWDVTLPKTSNMSKKETSP